MKIVEWMKLSANQQQALLSRPALDAGSDLQSKAAYIVEQVKTGGDEALLNLTAKFDGAKLPRLAVSKEEFQAAHRSLSQQQKTALKSAIKSVETFHEPQSEKSLVVETSPGVTCERLIRPLESVGLYVPAGGAPLPSTVIMLAVPARIAGCPTRILCSPPRPDGLVDPAVLVAAELCDVKSVFKIGGAQAVAAMAYGTESVPKAVKIFGPGNAWVTAAKQIVSQDPAGAAIDLPAGPSELMVIADDGAEPQFVAADLLSQAEHGPDSQVLLITTSRRIAELVAEQVKAQMLSLSRLEIIKQSLARSAIVVVKGLDEALDISNRYAPEHLILQVDMPRQCLRQVHNAGSVFLGPWAPESVGDYCSGTNHVLPTYGYARSHSGLGVPAFQKWLSVQELTVEGLKNIGPVADTLASMEGLDAHARAVSSRLEALNKNGAA